MSNDCYKNILVPYDDSKFSQQALKIAKTFAKSYGSTLHIATVVDISSVESPGIIRSKETKKTIGQIRVSVKRSAESLIQQKKQECLNEKINAKGWVVEGLVSNELLKLIKELKIDLVFIGSKGLSGFSRIKALGSVSRKISELADCPVMIIH